MDVNKLQKIVDNALAVLSDHDDKKSEDRYKNLRSSIEEAQDYIDKGNYSDDLTLYFYNDMKKGMKKFEESRIVFLIFLIILCGILFIGVFSITYSHFGGHWPPFWPGEPQRPTYPVTPPTTNKTSSTTKTTTQEKDDPTKTTVKTTSKDDDTTKKTTSSTSKVSTEKVTTPTETTDPTGGMVSVIFDNSSLIDLENLYPVDDNIGLNSTPTTWSLSSQLTGASRDYTVSYTIDFVDSLGEIPIGMLLDVKNLKYQLLIKNRNNIVYNSGVQLMKDYPEVANGVRPIITASASNNTFKNGETLDFELRMWLDSETGNDQQGKKYKFKIDVSASYDFE